LPLLADVYFRMQSEPFGQAIFDWCAKDLCPSMQDCLRERLADPDWQLEGRKQIWSEIGKQPLGPIKLGTTNDGPVPMSSGNGGINAAI
jgi:hypothetical protein